MINMDVVVSSTCRYLVN